MLIVKGRTGGLMNINNSTIAIFIAFNWRERERMSIANEERILN